MYSRSISFPNSRSNVQAASKIHGEVIETSRIPVKSFIDKSAYEHFGTIGENDSKDSLPQIQAAEVPKEQKNTDTAEKVEEYQKKDAPDVEKTQLTLETIEKEKEESGDSVLKSLSKLLGNIDSDSVLLIAAAVLILMFSSDNKSSITPIALLAAAII